MRRAWAALERGAGHVSALLLFTMFVAILVGVAARYLFARPLAWVDEIVVVMFVWMVFWTGAMVISEREHVAFEIFYEMLPPSARRAAGLLGAALTAALLYYALPKTVDYILFIWREKTPVLLLRLDFVYACFALFVAASALRFTRRFLDLARPGWRERL